MALPGLVDKFQAAGGSFITPAEALTEKLDQCRGVVFDWDGVFNSGRKGQTTSSGFSEADSMGTNMLRYGLWRTRNALPVCAIVTGESNDSARLLAEREHFDALYQGVRNKGQVIEEFCSEHGLARDELACVFDDINDLGMASGCAVRILVRRHASPLLEDLVVREALCDYITASQADGYAVREASELLLGLMGAFDAVVRSRTAVDEEYARYFEARQAVDTVLR